MVIPVVILAAALLSSLASQQPLGPAQLAQAQADKEAQHQAQRHDRYHWYALTAAQHARLIPLLRAIDSKTPTWVLCDQTLDCRDLAQSLDQVLDEAGWDSTMERPGGLVDGIEVTCVELGTAINAATGLEIRLVNKEDPTHCAINIGHKRPRR
jgi:hypothetical protein